MLRSVCANCSQKHMHLACLTPHTKWVICILPAKQYLPVFYLCIRYIEVRMYLAICYPTYFRVAIRLHSFPCLNSYSFLSFHAYKVYMYVHIPKSPAKNTTPQLWTLITFFGSLRHIFGKVLDIIIYQYHSPKNCSFFALSQKS